MTVSAWKSPKYIPSEIADPIPAEGRARILVLHEDAYDKETDYALAIDEHQIF